MPKEDHPSPPEPGPCDDTRRLDRPAEEPVRHYTDEEEDDEGEEGQTSLRPTQLPAYEPFDPPDRHNRAIPEIEI